MIVHNKIKSGPLYLKTLRISCASIKYLTWMNDPELVKYLDARFNPPKNLKDIKNFISECVKSSDKLLMGIFLEKNQRHIGNTKLGSININQKNADVGFFIGDVKERGKGYATKAIDLLCNYAFNIIGLKKITAGTYAENIASQKALLNAGFVQEGVLRSHLSWNGKRQDGYIFGRVVSEHE